MLVAVPMFGSRVSPRCLPAREMMVSEITEGRTVSCRKVETRFRDETDFLEQLIDLGVELLVCGGINCEFESDLQESGVKVVKNVAGEVADVLEAFRGGGLRSGYGLRSCAESGPSALSDPARGIEVDCVACPERPCMAGGDCSVDLGAWSNPWLRGRDARIYEVGRDVSAECDPKLCRIAELVHFCTEAGFSRIGLAFCWEMFREVDTLVRVLSRFFTVVPVCCRIGNRNGDGRHKDVPVCNPIAQARLLKHAKTDLNVQAGLCLGCDVLFTARSHAPVTTLFVKDRSLAHNPVGAIYTRYHLEELEKNPLATRAPRPLTEPGQRSMR